MWGDNLKVLKKQHLNLIGKYIQQKQCHKGLSFKGK